MDINREWRKVRHCEWSCGPFTITKFIKIDIWYPNGMRCVASNFDTIGQAKAWLKANWRRLEKERVSP